MCRTTVALTVLVALAAAGPNAQPDAGASLAARVDSFVEKPRLLVLTDIGNEPDDQMSMVRLLVYANQFEIEGLVATTSTWQKRAVKPEILHELIDAYAAVQQNLRKHQPGFPGREPFEHLARFVSLRELLAAEEPVPRSGHGRWRSGSCP